MTYKAKTKIAFMVPHRGQSGAEATLEQLLFQLPQDLFEVYLIAPPEQPLIDAAEAVGFFTYKRKFPEFKSTSLEIRDKRITNPFAILYNLIFLVLLAIDLNQWLKKHHIRILYTISIFGHIAGALACIGIPCKLIWHVHEILSSKFGRRVLGYFANQFVDEIITPSRAVADSILFKKTITIIPNGVSIEKYANAQESQLRQQLKIDPNIPIIGLIGRLTVWKGQQLFIEAVANLCETDLKGHYVIVGDTIFGNRDYRTELQQLSKTLNVESQVTFLGFRKDIPNILKSVDIVVVPSIRPEPFGLIAIEAMASGKPVIGSNTGGLADIILHKETGLLFKTGDVNALSDAITKLITNPEVRNQYGKKGFERASQEYTVERYVSQSIHLLKEISGITIER